MENEKEIEIESSSSNDEEDDKILEARAEELERQISRNLELYDVHVELVQLHRKLGDLKSMRAAFERFCKAFPLTPDLWLSWIHDEIKVASSSDEKKNVLSLFAKAVEDYQSVTLWQEYAQYSIGVCALEETRSIFERGLNSVGLHISEGSLLWGALRQLELHQLWSAILTDKFEPQLHKVVDVYRRQLSIPLLDMENTSTELHEFLKQFPDDIGIDLQAIDRGFKKALKQLEIYKPFEKRILKADNDNLYNIYKEYIDVIKDPFLTICTYERAVSQMCHNVDLWLDYTGYSLKFDIGLNVNRRAYRNCPSNLSLCIMQVSGVEFETSSLKVKVDKSSRVCYKCKCHGHYARECHNDSGVNYSGGREKCNKSNRLGHLARNCKEDVERCYRCNGEGHFAKDCKQSRDMPSCYSCNKLGHIARSCPEASGGGSGMHRMSSQACRTCKKVGHISRNCPENTKICYKCQKPGHFMRDCDQD